ncbi:MAG TPA: DUF3267 domain-containing protein [Dongiaceae bacterium]|nr:DUF3267 domain-containing protein [Dongiaceae bacterium]
MRFRIGAIPESPDFTPDASWHPLREPSPRQVQLLALPIGLLAAGGFILLWWALTPPPGIDLPRSVLKFGLTFGGIIVVHELIHALVHPRAGVSRHSILGVWPARLIFYAHYDGELTRNRFAAILLMPLLCLSAAPLVVGAVAHLSLPWLAFVSAFNAFLACGDILGASLVLYQIPAQAIVRNQGWKTYWRAP